MDKLLIVFLVILGLPSQNIKAQSTERAKHDILYVDAEFSTGYGTFQRWKSNVSFVPGLYINKHFSGGIGLRYNYVYSRWQELDMRPYDELGLEAKGYAYLKDTVNTPYLRISGGVIFTLPKNDSNTKPLFYSLGVGQRFKIKNKEILLTASYEYNKSRFAYSIGRGSYSSAYKSDWYRNHSVNGSIALRF
jgi:hypothetical protein